MNNKNNFDVLEKKFINDEDERVIISMGAKGSGKTTILLNFIKYIHKKNWYSEFHLVIPSFNKSKLVDGSDQYGFLRGMKNMFIYTQYDSLISDIVLKKCDGKKRIFYGIDDATSKGLDLIKDQSLLHLITTSRANKCKIWLCVHGSKKILSPIIRANIDYLFIHKISNKKLLEAIFEEWFSMIFNDFKDFLNFYNEKLNIRYNSVLLSCYHNLIDSDVKDWKINNSDDDNTTQQSNITNNKITVTPQNNKDNKETQQNKNNVMESNKFNIFSALKKRY